ncbi:hypothetical protein ACK280_27370 [Mycobacterium sherrisii]|uniref:hypothetical protein n=1 Tax=Mycobacterium sherrisii TaxID=243061 RepID=UPI00397659ED
MSTGMLNRLHRLEHLRQQFRPMRRTAPPLRIRQPRMRVFDQPRISRHPPPTLQKLPNPTDHKTGLRPRNRRRRIIKTHHNRTSQLLRITPRHLIQRRHHPLHRRLMHIVMPLISAKPINLAHHLIELATL